MTVFRNCVISGQSFREFGTLFNSIRNNKEIKDAIDRLSFGRSFKFDVKLFLLKFDCWRIYYLLLSAKVRFSS